MAQASGEKSNPRPRSMLSGEPATDPNSESNRSAREISATKTIRVAPIASTICRPSVVPFIRASMELAYVLVEPRSTSSATSAAGSRGMRMRASRTPAGALISEAVSTCAAAAGTTPLRMVA